MEAMLLCKQVIRTKQEKDYCRQVGHNHSKRPRGQNLCEGKPSLMCFSEKALEEYKAIQQCYKDKRIGVKGVSH